MGRDALPTGLKIIEALWGDLVGDEDNLSSPSWHETEHIKTEKRFLSGDIEVLDWQQAKKELRSTPLEK
ncbi:MAG: hypothetical protein WAW41_19270 [Methylobacter sp.]